MKNIFKLQKAVALLMFISILILGVSCNDKKSEKNLKDQIDNLDDDENFAGSSKRDDICELMNKEDIMDVFGLSEENELQQKSSHGTICSYDWRVNKEEPTFLPQVSISPEMENTLIRKSMRFGKAKMKAFLKNITQKRFLMWAIKRAGATLVAGNYAWRQMGISFMFRYQ